MRFKKLWIAALIVLPVCAFGGGRLYAQSIFLPNTTINQIDVSGMNFEEARERIETEKQGSPVIHLYGRDSKKAEFPKESIGWEITADIGEAVRRNKEIKNPFVMVEEKAYQAELTVSVQRDKLKQQIDAVPFMEVTAMEPPKDARIEYNGGCGIVKETPGSLIKTDEIFPYIESRILSFQDTITLDDSCYETAHVTSKSPELLEKLETLKKLAGACVIYEGFNEEISLDASTFYPWINEDTFEIDQEAVAKWVSEIAKKTNTAYTKRAIRIGEREITVNGPYGFKIAEKKETEQLISDIRSGEIVVRKPIYSLEAASRNNELGNTFVEVDLTNQKVYLYNGGIIKKESSCVTGCVAKGHTTPPGIFPLAYRERNTVLKGPGYESPVSYWMPFNGGIGLHDANWRGSFGGNIYKRNGSHGCINLPRDMAAAIYEIAYAGMAVICHE